MLVSAAHRTQVDEMKRHADALVAYLRAHNYITPEAVQFAYRRVNQVTSHNSGSDSENDSGYDSETQLGAGASVSGHADGANAEGSGQDSDIGAEDSDIGAEDSDIDAEGSEDDDEDGSDAEGSKDDEEEVL